MSNYPVLLNLEKRKVVVIGGGKIATRKVKKLGETGAAITVIAPHCSVELLKLATAGRIQLKKREFQTRDIQDAFLIFTCTNNKIINQEVVSAVQPHQLVNDCSCKKNSDFFNVAVLEYEEMLIGISTNGNNPKKAKALKATLARLLATL